MVNHCWLIENICIMCEARIWLGLVFVYEHHLRDAMNLSAFVENVNRYKYIYRFVKII